MVAHEKSLGASTTRSPLARAPWKYAINAVSIV